MYQQVSLEVFVDGTWRELGEVEIPVAQVSHGYRAPGRFQYALSYLDEFGAYLFSNGLYAASVRYPLDFASINEPSWPAFLLDLLPTGAARDHWIKRLDLTDGPTADFELLKMGAINPPGNIRVKVNGGILQSQSPHPGFDFDEVVSRGVDFIDYAEKLGAIVSGTSGAQGVAPKFLLVQDKRGKWHGDGAIADEEITKNWLVKFPRGKKKRDYQILRAEAQYYEVARELGVKVKGPLLWNNDALFIPRFDRARNSHGKLVRHGMESLVSAMGISDFGVPRKNEDYVAVLNKYSSQPKADIREYVFRDFLNVVLGNTDNHGRNTAFLKCSAKSVEISPLYDFAPMVLDDAGIPRVSKWKEESFQIPDIATIQLCLVENGFSQDESREFLRGSYERLQNVNALLGKHGVVTEVREIATKKYDPFMEELRRFLEL